uniref:Agglutinin domain-containing protein n=1 Tax=Arundo donax TaxID=35708 RepID=A0A0A8YZ25_ARUDO
MLSSLPSCAAFQSKSNGKYLRYYVGDDEGAKNQLLDLSGDDVLNPYTRFHVEASSKHDGLVHIRCCYNNKYWVAQQGCPDEWWIAGGADEPEEDLSQQSCTLFQLKPVAEDPNTIRFHHAGLGKYSGIFSDSNNRADEGVQSCLHVGSEEQSEQFTLVILSQRLLPKYVCFKGENGRYLSGQLLNGRNQLLFSSQDIADPTTRHTSIANSNGTMVIKSDHFGLFWRNIHRSNLSAWIRAESSDPSNLHPDTLFQAFLLSNGGIGLLSIGNNRYCMRNRSPDVPDGLAAAEIAPSRPQVVLWCEEPVLSREIGDIEFRVSQARIYDERTLTLATASATNHTSSVMRVRFTMDFTVTATRGWSSSVMLRSPNVATTISSPTLTTDGRIVIPTGEVVTEQLSWGATTESRLPESVQRVVDMPAMTKVTVTYRARESKYDVPFSYRQVDKMIDGEEVTLQFYDGIYSGGNVHSVTFETKEEKIDQ